ncbi:MAG: PKD domain-containing protein [Ferruginibacter sp.]|nr:PKD domain-containing protein [Ferruginibacter sp.]
MKKILCILFWVFASLHSHAKHISGGEMYYDILSSTTSTKTYRITLILFRDESCFDCADMPPFVRIGVYNNDNNEPYGGAGTLPTFDVDLLKVETLPIVNVPLCISNQPSLRYTAGYYSFVVTLKNNSKGYTAAYQTCCRIDNINNIDNGVNGAGATYSSTIPGLNSLNNQQFDNAPRFSKGISIVCFNNSFILDFSANDPDGDDLIYNLCDAFNGGAAQNAGNITPSVPPYGSVDYISGFSGSKPLGLKADINPQTGIISGIAPSAGKYVISVCVSSYRNGKFIDTHRKDFIITVAACDFANAELLPEYITCDGYTFDFKNKSQSPLNQSFYWDFGDPLSGANNISTSPTPSHTFSSPGDYTVKFVVNRGTSCADSTTTILKVYPDFNANFTDNAPRCKDVPVSFTDKSVHNFGIVTSWKWNFGVLNTNADTSSAKNPVYNFTTPGNYSITLIAGSNRGCYDTITKTISIVDKPQLNLSTRDTIICIADRLQLNTNPTSTGSISWTPAYNISNFNSLNPIVNPSVDTTYFVNFEDNSGCLLRDSVKVKVIASVDVNTINDTTICRKDSVILKTTGNAIKYTWTNNPTLNNTSIKDPVAVPVLPSTTYYVKGFVGTCFDTDSVKINTIPYPNARAGKDTLICLGGTAKLSASGGISYIWSPALYLDNPNIGNPTIFNQPAGFIDYVVGVTDNAGCPKPSFDTVRVTVEKVTADAGPRDTSVVSGQPLQLNATGGTIYQWTPAQWLNNPNKSNPISNPLSDIEYVVKVSNAAGCNDTDTISVKYFTVIPDFYIPNAFSPNGDGLNDVIKPVALGIKSLDRFNIYNRWGQMIYSTRQIGSGWDGKYKGALQETGTYVWYIKGTDYTNKQIEKKGTLILIH